MSGSARTVKGGKAIYGAAVGILMLEARSPRIPGLLLPVFDMVSFVTWFHGGLVPRRWPRA
jgi:hypothetical protein